MPVSSDWEARRLARGQTPLRRVSGVPEASSGSDAGHMTRGLAERPDPSEGKRRERQEPDSCSSHQKSAHFFIQHQETMFSSPLKEPRGPETTNRSRRPERLLPSSPEMKNIWKQQPRWRLRLPGSHGGEQNAAGPGSRLGCSPSHSSVPLCRFHQRLRSDPGFSMNS